MSAWLNVLRRALAEDGAAVSVTVAGTRGSTPREPGAKMIVTARALHGTVGGGQLEHQCLQRATGWLRDPDAAPRAQWSRIVLGAQCGQCCGGVAEMLLERWHAEDALWLSRLDDMTGAGARACLVTLRPSRGGGAKWVVTKDDAFAAGGADPAPAPVLTLARRHLASGAAARTASVALPGNATAGALLETVARNDSLIAIFGAGHVGSACARVLGTLDARVLLIDSRPDVLRGAPADGVEHLPAPDPVAVVDVLPPDSVVLIMTHDHALDLALAARVLTRGDSAYCGVIGSRAKRRRFLKRLRAAGLSEAALSHLTCPVGAGPIRSKRPAHIAVAVAAEIVALCERATLPAHESSRHGARS